MRAVTARLQPPPREDSVMYVTDKDWLARTTEDVVEPDLEIVDPHHHLWGDRPGMTPYLVPDLHKDTGAGHNVVQTVFVDCMWDYRQDGPEHLRPVGETERAHQAAIESRVGAEIAAIVSYVDLTGGALVDEALAAHEAASPLFRGIRHAVAFDPSPDIRRTHTRPPEHLLADPHYRDGVRRLAARGHSADMWLYHPQISELTALAREVPEATLILDHIGAPLGVGPYAGRRDEVLGEWRRDMIDVAACPNVVVKVGGIGMAIYGSGYDPGHRVDPPGTDELLADWGDPIRFCIDTFGPDRCMFESNFPVDKTGIGYRVLWNFFKRVSSGYTAAERSQLFANTPRRTYRL